MHAHFIFSTRFASSRNSFKFVPINDKQNTTTFILSDFNGVCAISHAITSSFAATKSSEYTLWGTDLANRPSPHPKSATISLFGLELV